MKDPFGTQLVQYESLNTANIILEARVLLFVSRKYISRKVLVAFRLAFLRDSKQSI